MTVSFHLEKYDFIILKNYSPPEGFLPDGHRLILHFGAVDQWARIYVNGSFAAGHEDGYLPFCVDVTQMMKPGINELRVAAMDTLSTDYPHGKQSREPHGMWYTPVSGIWQTVWLEAVPEIGAVRSISATPDLDGVTFDIDTDAAEYTVDIPAAGVNLVSSEKTLRVIIPSPRLWTPEEPYIYDFTVSTGAETVHSYFALRTVTLGEVGEYSRVCLNGKPVFLHAVLDQGYFPDGIFLPSVPDEYARDISRMKELGFNTLRKHVKIEPECFYEACDRLGMLVLQDMVSAGDYDFTRDTLLPTLGFTRRRDTGRYVSPKRREIFEKHVSGVISRLYGHPCVVGYTLFNEGWGQYDSDRIYSDCKKADSTRFFISVSGWFAQNGGDADSRHVYFRSKVLKSKKPGKFLMLSECGGFSRRVVGHVMDNRKNYGYGARRDSEEALTARISDLYRRMILPSIGYGLCGSVYTQLSDVEGETNGLYTYDRQVCKVNKAEIKALSEKVFEAFEVCLKRPGSNYTNI